MRSYEASSAHKGLWLAQKMAPDPLNHSLTMWDVAGELDADAMGSAFRHVLEEAEVLRVTFVDDDGTLRMVPRELGDWQPFRLDLSGGPDPEQAAREALADLVRRPFDLEKDILIRLGVVRLAPARSLVVIAYHHLLSDGYGAGGLLSRRLAEVYSALVRGDEVPGPSQEWDAASFAALSAEYRASEQSTEDSAFWGDYLADAPPPAQLPGIPLSDAAREALNEPLGDADRWSQVAEAIGMSSRTLVVPRAEADRWTETAKSMGVWMSSLLTAAAAVYFRHRCGHPEFLFSLAVGNRVGAAGRTPGLAVNVVPVRARVPLGATFTEIADALGDETYEIFDHTACHYSQIQRASDTGLSGRGGFGAVLNVVEFVEQLRFGDSPACYFAATTGAFDELSLGAYTDGSPDSDLYIRLDAPAALYSRAELRLIGEELVAFLGAVTSADQDTPVGALDVLGGAERDRVLTASRGAHAALPGLTVPELFARQVARAPESVAVVAGEEEVSYRELDARSGRLAAALRRRDVGPETVVAVALPRSVDLVVALLGVAKAGGAGLPLDPATPAERSEPVVRGSSARLLLTDATGADALASGLGVPALRYDELVPETGENTGEGLPQAPLPAYPDTLLAVLHGEGPDGAARGIGVTHRNIERLALETHWREGAAGTVLWHAPPTSDALALEVWVPLLNGGRIAVAPEGEPDIDLLTASADAGGTAVRLSPGRFAALAADRPERLAALREVWTGPDRVPAAALRRIREACPGLTVVRGHGPAEATAFATGHRSAADAPAHRVGTWGRPMDNTALHVLGPGLAPVPVGVAGELYVSGPGVARGYLGRPAETAERFVPCPFGPEGGLMYRTGDRVRWAEDGHLEYVGRSGDRAQVRGFRVEPAEVEEALAEYPGLAQAAVVAREDEAGQQRLVAYTVPAGVPVEELRRYAAGRFPEFLVPSAFVALERLPETAAGRVDRASLPEPALDGGSSYRAPRNETERVLAGAFADVLELDRVGIDEDFFDLGGNSLRAIRLVGLIRSELGQEVSIRTLFAARTISGLSEMWEDLARSSRPTLRRRTKEGQVL